MFYSNLSHTANHLQIKRLAFCRTFSNASALFQVPVFGIRLISEDILPVLSAPYLFHVMPSLIIIRHGYGEVVFC